jgi:hypothetical protein
LLAPAPALKYHDKRAERAVATANRCLTGPAGSSTLGLVRPKRLSVGELWRMAEQHSINCYDVPMLYGTDKVRPDLRSGRYLVMGPCTGEPRFFESIRRGPADYKPAALRALGRR